MNKLYFGGIGVVEVRNCARCGKLFRPVGGRRVCQKCVDAERAEFESVREYIRRNPKSTVMEVSQETGVPVKTIRAYVRDGRLIAAGDDWDIKCEKCGTKIESGRLCPECTSKLEREIRKGASSSAGRRGHDGAGSRLHRDRFRRR